MNILPKMWWHRRRFIFPVTTLLLLAISLIIAVYRSGTSQVMIYNHTGADLGPLTVRACGQEFNFPNVPDETSVHVRLRPSGGGSEVELSSTATSWHWEGSFLESRGGYLVFIHLRRGLEVETSSQISIWQQIVFGRTAGN